LPAAQGEIGRIIGVLMKAASSGKRLEKVKLERKRKTRRSDPAKLLVDRKT